MEDADEEAQRLEELRRIKRATLHELDKQAAGYSEFLVPPHIQTERQRLRRELGMVESVIASPLDATIGNDLGEGGRFVAYVELVRQGDRATLEAVARLEERFSTALDRMSGVLHTLAQEIKAVDKRSEDRDAQSEQKSMVWRSGGTIALVVIVIVVVAIALIVVYQFGRSEGQSFVRNLVGIIR